MSDWSNPSAPPPPAPPPGPPPGPPQAQGWAAPQPTPPAQRRGVPIWVVVVVALGCLLVGGVGGGVVGFGAGVVVTDLDENIEGARDRSEQVVGRDAGPVVLGDFEIEVVEVSSDFVDDFQLTARVTNLDGRPRQLDLEVQLLADGRILGAADSWVGSVEPGASDEHRLISLDRYDDGYDELRIIAEQD